MKNLNQNELSKLNTNELIELIQEYQKKEEQDRIEQEEYEAKLKQQAEIILLLKTENERLQADHDKLIDLIANAKRSLYGSKSEKSDQSEDVQVSLFDESGEQESSLNPDIEKNEQYEQTEEIRYTRKKSKVKSNNLPVRIIQIPVDERNRICSCGACKNTIRYEISRRFHHQKAILEIIEEQREIVGCPKGCEKSIAIAPIAPRALPKIKATNELLSLIAVSKFSDRQPLYHLEQQFEKRYGLSITRSTMARWMIKMAEIFIPIINAMKDVFLSYDVAYMDATSLQVLKETDRRAQTKSYAYSFEGGPPDKKVIIFEYNAIDHKQFLLDFLAGFKGIIHSDAAPIYNDLEKSGNIKLSYCNAHARRRFEAIVKNSKKPGIAKNVLSIYAQIYKIEAELKDKKVTMDHKLKIRQTTIKDLMNQLYSILENNIHLTNFKMPISEAILYTKNHWTGLTRFLDDPRLDPDNNRCERNIKPFVIARKNFLFADSIPGAIALAAHFSLISTAQLHGFDPYDYYVKILNQIPFCKNFQDYEQLLPWNINSGS